MVRQNRSPTIETEETTGVASFAVQANPKQLHRYSSFTVHVRLDDGQTIVAIDYTGKIPAPGSIVTLSRFRHESGPDTYEVVNRRAQ